LTPNRKDELVFAWLTKAKHDLEAAQLLIRDQKRLLDIGVYHCQQAAEKALKAWLTAEDIVFPKTHSLEELLALCIPSAGGFAQFRAQCEQLSPLAHEFRYPGDAVEPPRAEAEQALASAEEISSFCHAAVRGVQQ
jgi:HEPN domain-containing protein